jgi:uncharacterized membrane protein
MPRRPPPAAFAACDPPGRTGGMKRNRLEAFSDGVIAILITIMVLELTVPLAEDGGHADRFADLWGLRFVFLSYVLSFVYLAIYWNNHHHLLAVTERVTGGVLWANMFLLFCLSLVPFATSWMGENAGSPAPAALYGLVFLLAAVAYFILVRAILRGQGRDTVLGEAIGRDRKGIVSVVLYLAAVPLAFVQPWIAYGIYALVALIWLVPDQRIERALAAQEEKAAGASSS